MRLYEMSLSGGLLILAAVCLRPLGLPRETFVALWWAAAVRLLLPLRIAARCSVHTLLYGLKTAASPAEGLVPPRGGAVRVLPGVPAVSQPAAPPFSAGAVLRLLPTVLLVLWFLWAYVRWKRRFRQACPAEHPWLRQWQAERRIPVLVSGWIAAPLTIGLLRPKILLSETMDLNDQRTLLCVLTHEEFHIRHWDNLLKWLLAAALCVHWFNPAVWLLYILANRDLELRCDEAAVRRLGEEHRKQYALTLLRMAELQSVSMPLCSFFGDGGMEERIRVIMKVKQRSAAALLAALTLALCVTAVFATSAKVEEEIPSAKTREDVLTPDARRVQALTDSVRCEGGKIYFTIPEGEGRWNIWISGRLPVEDGSEMIVHYLEEESERGEWISGKTYAFETAEAVYKELAMDAEYGRASCFYDLTLLLPVDRPPLPVVPLPEGKADVPEDGSLVWPVDSDRISEDFGQRTRPGGTGTVTHSAVDIAAERRSPIYAAGAGTVEAAGFDASYGSYVLLDHGGGLETFYAHCQTLQVEAGETVARGQTIASVGSTGMSTGPHLHFEIRVDGTAQDPGEWFSLQRSQDLK